MVSRSMLVAVLLLALGGTAYLFFVRTPRDGRGEGPSAVGGLVLGPSEVNQLVEGDALSRESLVAPIGVQEYLEQYWGEKWSRIKEEYSRRNIDLHAALGESLKPWEEVQQGVIEAARSYYERDLVFSRKMFCEEYMRAEAPLLTSLGLDPEEKQAAIEELNAELTDIDAEIEVLGDQYVRELDSAMAREFAQDPERFPLVDLRSRESRAGDFHSIDVEKGGWFVRYACNYSECPDLAKLVERKNELLKQRTARTMEFIGRRKSTNR